IIGTVQNVALDGVSTNCICAEMMLALLQRFLENFKVHQFILFALLNVDLFPNTTADFSTSPFLTFLRYSFTLVFNFLLVFPKSALINKFLSFGVVYFLEYHFFCKTIFRAMLIMHSLYFSQLFLLMVIYMCLLSFFNTVKP
ncbi:hypothetical protein L9F63_008393, partial [Diploptera punctata]